MTLRTVEQDSGALYVYRVEHGSVDGPQGPVPVEHHRIIGSVRRGEDGYEIADAEARDGDAVVFVPQPGVFPTLDHALAAFVSGAPARKAA